MSSLFARLEIVHRLDDVHDFYGVRNIGNDFLHRLISHRAFINSGTAYRGGEDMSMAYEFENREELEGDKGTTAAV